MKKINTQQISVVVQGPVRGKPGDPSKQCLTENTLRSLRRHLPGAQLILSTYVGSDTRGLDYDRLVESEDPGALPFLRGVDRPNNANRQIVTTVAGLRAADRPYAMKFRSDMLMTHPGFLDHWGRYPARADEWRILGERVLTCTRYARNPRRRFTALRMPFHPSDWFYFGRHEDVLDLFDLPLLPEPQTSLYYDTHPRPELDVDPLMTAWGNPEQVLWVSFLNKHGDCGYRSYCDISEHSLCTSELSIVNNLVLLDLGQLGIRYVKEKQLLKHRLETYSYGEWRRLYRRYCDPTAPVPPDLVPLKREAALILLQYHFLTPAYVLRPGGLVRRTLSRAARALRPRRER